MITAHRMGGGRRRGAVVRRIEDRKKKHSKRIKNSGRTHRSSLLVPMATACRLMVTSFRRCSKKKTSVFRYLLSGYGSPDMACIVNSPQFYKARFCHPVLLQTNLLCLIFWRWDVFVSVLYPFHPPSPAPILALHQNVFSENWVKSF